MTPLGKVVDKFKKMHPDPEAAACQGHRCLPLHGHRPFPGVRWTERMSAGGCQLIGGCRSSQICHDVGCHGRLLHRVRQMMMITRSSELCYI